jgi:hypothetical protein
MIVVHFAKVASCTSFLPFLHFLLCMAQRSLHVITKVYYRSMSCFAIVSRVDTPYHDPAFSATVSQGRFVVPRPSCTMWTWAKSQANPHSSEQDTQPIVFLISKQAAPYRIRGVTCHDGINHLHHSTIAQTTA